MKFFLYSENLNPTQLKRRAPEHKFLFKAYLPDHTIQFCRFSSQWRGGIASVAPSPGERVWGAVFEITEEDLKILDKFEDEVPEGAFRHLEATVITDGEQRELVKTHIAKPIGKFRVKDHYLDFVLKGIAHWDLPEECRETWDLFRPKK